MHWVLSAWEWHFHLFSENYHLTKIHPDSGHLLSLPLAGTLMCTASMKLLISHLHFPNSSGCPSIWPKLSIMPHPCHLMAIISGFPWLCCVLSELTITYRHQQAGLCPTILPAEYCFWMIGLWNQGLGSSSEKRKYGNSIKHFKTFVGSCLNQ
jgi:hypothetical protein